MFATRHGKERNIFMNEAPDYAIMTPVSDILHFSPKSI
jgi:hypothetical protein